VLAWLVQVTTTVQESAGGGGTDWDPWVAIGTLLLALATVGLAIATFRMAASAGDSVKIQERQLVAAQRPYVFPAVTAEWLQHPDDVTANPYIVAKNGGAGPAFNVQGSIYWGGDTASSGAFAPTALAAGEEENVRVRGEGITVDFNNARGFLRYTDSAGVEWQTHFRYTGALGLVKDGTMQVRILTSGTTAELGEPQYNADQWVNAPAGLD
jgi:hypothetical protein